MPNYTVRVELHDADESDYKTLHKAMTDSKFLTTITGADGIARALPPAEYNKISTDNIDTIRDQAAAAVKATKKSGGVLVTCGQRAWVGLKSAK